MPPSDDQPPSGAQPLSRYDTYGFVSSVYVLGRHSWQSVYAVQGRPFKHIKLVKRDDKVWHDCVNKGNARPVIVEPLLPPPPSSPSSADGKLVAVLPEALPDLPRMTDGEMMRAAEHGTVSMCRAVTQWRGCVAMEGNTHRIEKQRSHLSRMRECLRRRGSLRMSGHTQRGDGESETNRWFQAIGEGIEENNGDEKVSEKKGTLGQ